MEKGSYFSEIGKIRDIFAIFVYHHSTDQFLANTLFGNHSSRKADINYYETVMSPYKELISDDTYLFFALFPSKQSFMVKQYANATSITEIKESFEDSQQIVKQVFEYYLPDIDPSADIKTVISQVCHQCELNDKMKTQLLNFMVDPATYIEALLYEIGQISQSVDIYYDKHKRDIERLNDELDYQKIVEFFAIGAMPEKSDNLLSWDSFNYTFTLFNKNLVRINHDLQIVSLGINYKNRLKEFLNHYNPNALLAFCSACDIDKRLMILEYIQKRGEATTSEIAQHMALDSPNSSLTLYYYHLETLSKAGVILNSTHSGRTVYYKLNREFIGQVIDSLKSLLGGTTDENMEDTSIDNIEGK